MIKKICLSLILMGLSITASNNTVDHITAIKNQLVFIADQKNIILQEEPVLTSNYICAKKSLYESIGDDSDTLVSAIEKTVSLVLESEEFANYSEYMTDFQCSLIITGGLKAQELPSTNPDKALFIKINAIITENLPTDSLKTPEIHTFLGTLLTLEANKIGTKLLLEKLSLKEQQLITELQTHQAII